MAHLSFAELLKLSREGAGNGPTAAEVACPNSLRSRF